MARIVGGIGTSHAPSIAFAHGEGKAATPEWRPLFDAYGRVKDWLDRARPDIAVVFYNDHLNSFFFDRYPTFALGVAEAFPTADEGFGKWPYPDFPGDPAFGWHLGNSLVAQDFDMTICQEMAFDHGIVSWAPLFWDRPWPVRIVPIAINVIQYPLPSARRCFQLGQAVRRAIDSYEPEARIVVIGTGGLSHQTSAEGFGFVNPDWDRNFMDLVETAPETLTHYSHRELVALGGAESVEVIMWLAMRGALQPNVRRVFSNYAAPMLTGYGLMVLEEAV
jgi:protocatechuate 4,5-dioxygenase, beta chain